MLKKLVSVFFAAIVIISLVGCGSRKREPIQLTLSTEEALFTSTGTFLAEYDPAEGIFKQNLDDPRIERAANRLYDVMKNELCFPMWTIGWAMNYGAEGGGMKEGKTLFAMDQWYVFDECRSAEEYERIFGDIRNNELMIVPVPRDPNGDGEYYIDSKIKGYNLIKGAPHPEAVALLENRNQKSEVR